jgi:dolichol-phosphate mannosyltransferase
MVLGWRWWVACGLRGAKHTNLRDHGRQLPLNNELTCRDRRLKGLAMFGGFLGFCAIGSVGALTNVGLANWLYSERSVWWVAGAAGAIMGALWNYALSSLFVWRTR